MRRITEFLSTKIKGKNRLINLDDVKQTIDSMVKFLEQEGFKEIDVPHDVYTYGDLIEYFVQQAYKSKFPIFMLSTLPHYDVIRFSKNGEISEENPIFSCRISKSTSESNNLKHNIEDNTGHTTKWFEKFEQFLEYANKYFEWE